MSIFKIAVVHKKIQYLHYLRKLRIDDVIIALRLVKQYILSFFNQILTRIGFFNIYRVITVIRKLELYIRFAFAVKKNGMVHFHLF